LIQTSMDKLRHQQEIILNLRDLEISSLLWSIDPSNEIPLLCTKSQVRRKSSVAEASRTLPLDFKKQNYKVPLRCTTVSNLNDNPTSSGLDQSISNLLPCRTALDLLDAPNGGIFEENKLFS